MPKVWAAPFVWAKWNAVTGDDLGRAPEICVPSQVLPPSLRPWFPHLCIRASWDHRKLDLFLISNSVQLHLLVLVPCFKTHRARGYGRRRTWPHVFVNLDQALLPQANLERGWAQTGFRRRLLTPAHPGAGQAKSWHAWPCSPETLPVFPLPCPLSSSHPSDLTAAPVSCHWLRVWPSGSPRSEYKGQLYHFPAVWSWVNHSVPWGTVSLSGTGTSVLIPRLWGWNELISVKHSSGVGSKYSSFQLTETQASHLTCPWTPAQRLVRALFGCASDC